MQRDLNYFDYIRVAQEAGIREDQLEQIERYFRADYPADDMLYELHVLRACMSVKNNHAHLQAVLDSCNQARIDADDSTTSADSRDVP